MNRLHRAEVLSHAPAGRGYHRLVLKAPEAAAAAVPGQFIMLRVSENADPLLARPFGISSVPTRSSIELFYRVVGKGTNMLSRASEGTVLQMLGPIGMGFPFPEKNVAPLMIAGGSGFPPLHFFALRVGRNGHAFFGSGDCNCQPPARVLASFRRSVRSVHIATEDGSAGKQGFVTALLQDFLDSPKRPERAALYACGPHAMLAAVSRIAEENGLPCFVSLEERMACGLGACMGCSIPMKTGGYKRACKEGPVFDAREIDWSERMILPIPHRK